MCLNTPAPNDRGFWIFTAPAGPPAPGPSDWQPTGQAVCRDPNGATVPAVPAVVLTAADFRRLPLPAAALRVQPPNRRTLINVPTNLYADAEPVTLPTTLLGRSVQVRATAAGFHWTYGDGTARTTTDPGAPYPQLRTAHTYRRPGTLTLTLSTTYTGEYSVSGGPWQPVNGTATVASPPTTLTVLAATTHLVSEPLP